MSKYSLIIFSISCILFIPCASGQTNSSAAMQARIELISMKESLKLENGFLTRGDGHISRIEWMEPSYTSRTYAAQIEISWFHWTEFSLRITPSEAGRVELRLSGPWLRDNMGMPIRCDILWDKLTAWGTILQNGSFEKTHRHQPQGWIFPMGAASRILHGPPEPVDGRNMVCTWHDKPLTTSFDVSAGRTFTINGFARLRNNPHKEKPARYTPGSTPAWEKIQRFKRGVNLGNRLEAPPGDDWGAEYTTSDFAAIQKEGFDHIRLPVAWHHYTGNAPEYKLTDSILHKADNLVTNALAHNLGVIINLHHFEPFMVDPMSELPRFTAIWKQLGRHYADYPPTLAFELLNEPKGNAAGAKLNQAYAAGVAAIRESNPERLILIGPANYNDPYQLRNLLVPADSNLAVTVHMYRPFLFTHQGAAWAPPQAATTGITYPGPPSQPVEPNTDALSFPGITSWFNRYNQEDTSSNPVSQRAFTPALELALQWMQYSGIPVRVGEFGCIRTAAPASRARYYKEVRTLIEKHNMGWTIWDWKAFFRYWNPELQQPEPGMRDALFSNP